MSSLGDLLLLHSKQANEAEKVSDSDNNCDNDNRKQSEQLDLITCQTNQEKSLSSPNLQSIPIPSPQLNSDSIERNKRNRQQSPDCDSNSQSKLLSSSHTNKVFPKYIERNDVEDTRSNASSVDDYVAELLDPNDRPKNVWHVVETPKVDQTKDDNMPNDDSRSREQAFSPNRDSYKESKYEARSVDDYNVTSMTPPPPPSPPADDHIQVDRKSKEGYNDVKHDDRKSNSRSDRRHQSRHNEDRDPDHRTSSSQSSRRRDDRTRDRDRGRNRDYDRTSDKDRNRDKDRHRHRSSNRRRESDDDDNNHKRRRSSHRRQRSRSRSPRSPPIRRRERSRSNSSSPLTKRNSRTILIMQLGPRVETRDLEDFFSDIGRVREVRLIMDTKTRRHKGIAYIEFENSYSASKALAFNGKKLFGSPVVVQAVNSERSRATSGERQTTSSHNTSNYNAPNTTSTSHTSSRSYLPPNCYRIYVGGLNVNLTEDMIRSIFEPFGPIVRLELMRDRTTNVPRGYAFITFADIEDGQNAVQCMDGFELAGKNLRVSKSADRNERQPGGHNPSNSGIQVGGSSGQDYGQSSLATSDHFNDINDPYSGHQKYR